MMIMKNRYDFYSISIYNWIVGVLFIFLFAVWGTDGHFWKIATSFFPYFHMALIFSFFFFFYLLTKKRKFLYEIFCFFVRYRYVIIVPAFFSVSLFLTYFFSKTTPEVIDEYHFIWIARMLLKGDIVRSIEVPYDHFSYGFFIQQKGVFSSIFPPGFSFFLLPFVWMKVPWLLNSLLASLCIFTAGKTADYMEGAETSLVSMLIGAFSYTMLQQSIMIFSHPLSIFLTLVCVYLLVTGENRLFYTLFAGLVLGILIFVRPQNAFFTAIAVFLYFLFSSNKRKIFHLFTFAAPLAFAGGGYLLLNRYITGNFFVFPQDIFFRTESLKTQCHGFGFGKGCAKHQGIYLRAGGFSVKDAMHITMLRLSSLSYRFFSHPLILIMSVFTFFLRAHKYFLIISVFIFILAGYFFFYIPGIKFGARYMSEAGTIFLIPAGAGFTALFLLANSVYIRSVLLSILSVSLIYPVFTFFPQSNMLKKNEASYKYKKAKEQIKEKNIENSMIFISRGFSNLALKLKESPPFDKRGNIILNDHLLFNSSAIHYYKNKNFSNAYRFIKKDESFEVVKIPKKEKKQKTIRTKIQTKNRPLSGKCRYVDIIEPSRTNNFFFLENENLLSIIFGNNSLETYYDFGHYFHKKGSYRITFSQIKVPCGGDMTFTVNGEKVKTFSSFSEKTEFDEIVFDKKIEKGLVIFAVIPHEPNTCIVADMLLAKQIN